MFGFTIRDSLVDLINVSVWGSEAHVQDCYSLLKLGDVGNLVPDIKYNMLKGKYILIVELKNGLVTQKPLDGSDERFKPKTNRYSPTRDSMTILLLLRLADFLDMNCQILCFKRHCYQFHK